MSGSQVYSQFTNSVSTTTLNTLNQQQQQQQQGQHHQVGGQSSSISPFNGPSDSNHQKPSKQDSKSSGLNIFNVDFLTRKNRERKEKKNAAAAAAATTTTTAATTTAPGDTSTISTSTTKGSKFSRGKKTSSKQNAANTSSQYENLG